MTWTARLLRKVARSLIAWAERSADPAEREWIRAMRAELDLIDGGLAQLSWAVGVLPVLWRAYRVDILRCMVCVTAVVVANYAYPKFAPVGQVFHATSDGKWICASNCGQMELFFFAQQFYLPVVGILAAQATRRVLAGTLIGIGLSLLGYAVLQAVGYGSSSATTALGTGVQVFQVFFVVGSHWVADIYVQIFFFALVGASFGTLGATAGLWTSRQTVTT